MAYNKYDYNIIESIRKKVKENVSKLENKKGIVYTISLLILSISFASLTYSQQIYKNLLSCGIYDKASVPADYQPIFSLMVEPNNIIGGKVGNAHIANFSSKYDYNLYCSAGVSGDVGGIILGKGESCFSKKMMEVINASGKENAHVQSTKCKEPECSNKYNYQVCIYPYNYKSYVTLLCQIEDNKCDSGETCLFKFAGENYPYTNAHIYDCNYPNLPTNTKAVCCTYTISNIRTPIIKPHNPYNAGDEHKIFIPLGMLVHISLTLYNPDTRPHIIDLYLSTENNDGGKVFSNFIWFEDESKKYSGDPRHIQVLLNPLEKKTIRVNVFGGIVGEYKFYISQKNKAGKMERIATYNVYILPTQTEGITGNAPEFPTWGYFLILLISSTLLLLNINKKLQSKY